MGLAGGAVLRPMENSLISPPAGPALLERSDQLTILAERLGRVSATQEGALVLVRGEAGAGKTALVSHFCAERCPPARLLWGACDSLLAPRALGPFADVARVTGGELEELVERGGRPHEVLDAFARVVAQGPPA